MFFHALTFARFQGSCLNMKVLKHLLRDPGSVNTIKQTYMILLVFPYSNQICTENAVIT